MSDETSQIDQIMKTARDLIQEGKFAEAREALRPIENAPAAQEWIARLDERLKDKAEALAEAEAKAQAKVQEEAEAAARAAAKVKAEAEAKAQAAARAAEDALRPVSEKPFRPGANAPAALSSVVKAVSGQGIQPSMAATALGLAAVMGLAAALLDALLGIPGNYLPFALGWGVALLAGPAYAIMHQRVDRGAWIMAAVAGAVTLLFWFLLSQVTVGEPDIMDGDFSARDFHNGWFDEYITLPKALWSGAILGLIGLGWYSLLPRVPALGERALKSAGERMKR